MLLNIVTEKVGNLFHKITGLVCIFHHGKLGTCVEGIKQKVRINLILKGSQLGIRIKRLHFNFFFFKVCFNAGFFPDCINVLADTYNHPVKGAAKISNFII